LTKKHTDQIGTHILSEMCRFFLQVCADRQRFHLLV